MTTDPNIKTFENEAYSIEATEESGCLLNVSITMKPKKTEQTYKKATKKVNKQISIPGFRKGHAPDQTVISRYASYIDQEWKDIVVNEAYRAALDMIEIYPINKESIRQPKIEKCSREEGAIVQLSYEHYPNVPVIEFSEISIPEIEKEPVSEKRVNEILDEIRHSFAEFEKITGRVVDEEDYVDLTIHSLEEEPPKPLAENRRFYVSAQMAPWLKKLLLGLNSGDVVEGVTEVEGEEATKNFKPTKVRIELNAIQKILLPELDDELSKKAGADSQSDLLQKINSNLDQEVKDEQHQKQLKALEEALLEQYHFDLPNSWLESERKERLNKRLQTFKEEPPTQEQREVIEREVEKETNASLRLYFLNKQIAKQGNLSISNEELNEELGRYSNVIYQQETESQEVIRARVSNIASALMKHKTQEYALSQVLT